MKLTHQQVKCECAKKNRVIIELTEHEAAHLADHFDDNDAKNMATWSSVRQLALEIQDLAGQW